MTHNFLQFPTYPLFPEIVPTIRYKVRWEIEKDSKIY